MYQLLMIQIDQVLDSRARARTQSACENGHKKCCHNVLLETLGFFPAVDKKFLDDQKTDKSSPFRIIYRYDISIYLKPQNYVLHNPMNYLHNNIIASNMIFLNLITLILKEEYLSSTNISPLKVNNILKFVEFNSPIKNAIRSMMTFLYQLFFSKLIFYCRISANSKTATANLYNAYSIVDTMHNCGMRISSRIISRNVLSTKVRNNEYNKLQDKKLQTTKNNLNLMVIGCKHLNNLCDLKGNCQNGRTNDHRLSFIMLIKDRNIIQKFYSFSNLKQNSINLSNIILYSFFADANVAKIKLTNQKEKSREKQRKGRLIYYFRTDENEIIFTGVNGASNFKIYLVRYNINLFNIKNNVVVKFDIIVNSSLSFNGVNSFVFIDSLFSKYRFLEPKTTLYNNIMDTLFSSKT
ncbi:hypothetical protein AGLY_017981 [Aphis glycines]|uniref:Uncharacterized protein n=1 Tax=Aphis glycines TaxID=307491 RepID=A0A6G0STC6_APHGL|nr:hypothetical protein AGLY_017981 [Aphis glycines]